MAVKNTVKINNSCFDLARTLDCGQAFRWVQTGENEWHGVAFSRSLTLRQNGDEIEFIGSSEEDFENIWKPYFDLDRDYSAICERLKADSHLEKAVTECSGILGLYEKQHPLEIFALSLRYFNNLSVDPFYQKKFPFHADFHVIFDI